MRVLIAGGGVGGLSLAQGLRKAGIAAEVFERDESAAVRGQGFRFRIDADGDAALEACLPANLYALYLATSSRPVAPTAAAYDWQMREVFRMPQPIGGDATHMSVNRRTLREVLLAGLEDSVRFGHALVWFKQSANGVTARFANGAEVTGDLLVAADGPEGKTLAMGMFRQGKPVIQAVRELAPHARLTAVQDYLMWLYVAPWEAFGLTDEELRFADCARLHSKALELTMGWHATLREIVSSAEVSTLFQIPIRTAKSIETWTPSRITLLGDAIHAMTPAGGIGANTAMRDAALLTRVLDEAQGGRDLFSAIAEYETSMRAYGFAAVRQSLDGAAKLYKVLLPVLSKLEVA